MRPSADVLDAFGASGPVVKLSGGRGLARRAGDVVLKPADVPVDELQWLSTIGRRSDPPPGLRLSLPLESRSGRLIVDGWIAFPALTGAHTAGRWLEIAAVAAEFSACFAQADRPAFLDDRDHAWARADRFAWDERDEPAAREVPQVAALLLARRPTTGVPGIIHGDLTGNVLFSPELPPAVIDPTVYWRPVAYSVAIVTVDAVCFEEAPLSLLERISDDPEFPQYALRALIFRIATDRLNDLPVSTVYDSAVRRVLDLVADASDAKRRS